MTEDAEGYLHFEGHTDDLIISSGYRIGPFKVESALVAHPAVAEAAVVAFPDLERGSVVRAVVVLRAGERPSASLARALQEHCRRVTAPYKYHGSSTSSTRCRRRRAGRSAGRSSAGWSIPGAGTPVGSRPGIAGGEVCCLFL